MQLKLLVRAYQIALDGVRIEFRPCMREAQERISARKLEMHGLTFKTLSAEIAAGLAQSLEERQRRALARAKALRGRRGNGRGHGAGSDLGRIRPRQRLRYPLV